MRTSVDSLLWTVSSGKPPVDSLQWTVSSGQQCGQLMWLVFIGQSPVDNLTTQPMKENSQKVS